MTPAALRAQVRQLLQARQGAAAAAPGAAPQPGLVVPLRLSTATDAATLAEIFRRVAASPALAQAAAAGLLRFDVRLDVVAAPATATVAAAAPPASMAKEAAATPPAACCDACARAEPCAGQGAPCAAPVAVPDTLELKGVVSERSVKKLPAGVSQVRLAAGAVLTPLGREALRQRGIHIHKRPVE